MNHPMKSIIPIITTSLTLLAVSSVASGEAFVRELERVFATAPNEKVAVDLHGAGDIHFEAGDSADQVRFEIEMVSRLDSADKAEEMFDRLEFEFVQQGPNISLSVKNKHKESGWKLWRSSKWPSLQIRVICPESYNVSADTGSGDISVDGISGKLVFDTGSGEVTVLNANGTLDADTGSGDVRIESFVGSVSADTGSGQVVAQDLTGSLNADTGSGDVRIQGTIDAFNVDTGSGDVRIDSDQSISKNSSVDTGSGSISANLKGQTKIALNLKTHSGRIAVNIPSLPNADPKKDTYRHQTHPDAPALKCNSGSGDISISHQ